jgi:Ca2+-binding RTX toxin-like protein
MARVNGTPRNDTLSGTKWADALFGYNGDDTISGGGGGDYIHGGPGVDRLYGGEGDDRLNFTTYQTDYSSSNTALEILDGGTGCDHAHIDVSGSKVDGAPTDTVYINASGTGKFSISIGADPDLPGARIATTNSVESFELRPDGPALSYIGNVGGPAINLFLTATNGDDEFVGGGESSKVNLLAGDDFAVISGGKDTFTLGEGADTVWFKQLDAVVRDGRITDFNPDEDVLDVSGWSRETLTVTEDASGTMLAGNDDRLYLVGVHNFDPWGDTIA